MVKIKNEVLVPADGDEVDRVDKPSVHFEPPRGLQKMIQKNRFLHFYCTVVCILGFLQEWVRVKIMTI